MKLEVKITKEIYEQSMMCGTSSKITKERPIAQNCAVALAVREIFPKAEVISYSYVPFGSAIKNKQGMRITAKHDGMELIRQFDSLASDPEKRLELPETIITLQITDEILEHMPLEWENIVEKSELLELVQ